MLVKTSQAACVMLPWSAVHGIHVTDTAVIRGLALDCWGVKTKMVACFFPSCSRRHAAAEIGAS